MIQHREVVFFSALPALNFTLKEMFCYLRLDKIKDTNLFSLNDLGAVMQRLLSCIMTKTVVEGYKKCDLPLFSLYLGISLCVFASLKESGSMESLSNYRNVCHWAQIVA